MSYTLQRAADACGVNKSTILRAVKSGRISGSKDDAGVWHVEAVELHRVFPPVEASSAAVPQHASTDALVAELRAVIADLRQDRDAWRAQAERLALPVPPKSGQTWWQWLRSTG